MKQNLIYNISCNILSKFPLDGILHPLVRLSFDNVSSILLLGYLKELCFFLVKCLDTFDFSDSSFTTSLRSCLKVAIEWVP